MNPVKMLVICGKLIKIWSKPIIACTSPSIPSILLLVDSVWLSSCIRNLFSADFQDCINLREMYNMQCLNNTCATLRWFCAYSTKRSTSSTLVDLNHSLTCLSDNHITATSDEYSTIYVKIPRFVEEWYTRENDKDGFFSFNEDKNIQTFHRYLDPHTGYVNEPEPCRGQCQS